MKYKKQVVWIGIIIGGFVFFYIQYQVWVLFQYVSMNDGLIQRKTNGILLTEQKLEKPLHSVVDFCTTLTNASVSEFNPYKALIALNMNYLKETGYTLTSMSIPAILICLIAYCIACVTEENLIKGHQQWPELFSEFFDFLPYVIWLLPFITLAFFLDLKYNIHFFLYDMIIYTGFGMFLMFFYIRQNRRIIKTLHAKGILDGERLLGISTLQLYFHLFMLQFRKKMFLRQLLYALIFIMLMDLTYQILKPVHMIECIPTTFTQCSEYYNLSKKLADKLSDDEKFLPNLNQLTHDPLIPSDIKHWINYVQNHPYILLSAEYRTQFRNRYDQYLTNRSDQKYHNQSSQVNKFYLSKYEHGEIFFHQLSLFYLRMNCGLILLLFILSFYFYDARELMQYA